MHGSSQMYEKNWPQHEFLVRLASEIDDMNAGSGLPAVLKRSEVLPYPCTMTPCVELNLDQPFESALSLSQKRAHGESYISVTGLREFLAKGSKKVRCKNPWPRTHRTDVKRPISLHAWITFDTYGLPPSREHQATHLCGNDACVSAAHLRWQRQIDNLADQHWHSNHSQSTPKTVSCMKRRFSRLAWPA